MKINTGQFNDSYFPIMDGVGMTVHNYAFWLNARFGRSVVIAPKVKGYDDGVDYKVYRFKSVLLPGMNPYRIGLPLVDVKFKKKLKKEPFDLIHAHCPFISGQLAMKLAAKRGIPLVATFHTKYREDFKKIIPNDNFADFLVKMTLDFYHAADLVLVPNKSTGQTLKDYGFKGQYEIMPNGTDMMTPDKARLIRERKRGLERIGASGDEFIMLFVGQHRWEKNIRMILEAMKILHDKEVNFRMIFVGEGYATREMLQFINETGMQEKVTLTGVMTNRHELQNIYAASDLFVFPSVYDNSPLVIQESAAYEIPSIVIRESSSAEGIEDGVNGFTIDNAPEALAETISSLMANPLKIKWVGEAARKTLHHPWEQIVDDVFVRYISLIREKKPQEWRQWDDEIEPETDLPESSGSTSPTAP
jgi:glycosyltransferase involved in cell wall biosynthesis